MRNNKGITLVTLIIYIILSFMVISALIVITSNFRKNFNELNVQSVHEVELDKINLQITREIKEENKIVTSQTTANQLVFNNGNTYSYVASDKTLYLNGKIAIAQQITGCEFAITDTALLRITVKTENKSRILEYAIEEI